MKYTVWCQKLSCCCLPVTPAAAVTACHSPDQPCRVLHPPFTLLSRTLCATCSFYHACCLFAAEAAATSAAAATAPRRPNFRHRSYDTALRLAPGFIQAFGGLAYTKTYVCSWEGRPQLIERLRRLIAAQGRGGTPVALPLQVCTALEAG